jgi:hypothetical protein
MLLMTKQLGKPDQGLTVGLIDFWIVPQDNGFTDVGSW